MINIKTDKHYLSRDPFFDWALTFTVTCVVSVILVVVGVYSYRGVDASLSEASLHPMVAKLPYDARALSTAVKLLDDRASNRNSVIENGSGVGDPSI
jgi:hypothetical protein